MGYNEKPYFKRVLEGLYPMYPLYPSFSIKRVEKKKKRKYMEKIHNREKVRKYGIQRIQRIQEYQNDKIISFCVSRDVEVRAAPANLILRSFDDMGRDHDDIDRLIFVLKCMNNKLRSINDNLKRIADAAERQNDILKESGSNYNEREQR